MNRPQMVRDLPQDERPRERLQRFGSASLSDSELVAILLRTGRRGRSVLDISRELLQHCGGLTGLLGSCPRALRRSGLGPAKIAALLAAVEIGRRLAKARLPDRELLAHPSAVASYLSLRYHLKGQEIMGRVLANTGQQLPALISR